MKIINEVKCDFNHEGKTFSARGAYLDLNGGVVYITGERAQLKATTWDGELISANVSITSEWTIYSGRGEPYTMRQVRFSTAPGITYTGRYGCDWAQACRVKRVQS